MRAGKIFLLTWDKGDLAQDLIRLGAEGTKTSEPRVVFLRNRAYDILKVSGRVRSLDHNRVFTYQGKPLKKIKKALSNACRKAGIVNFRCHVRRHTFITNLRKEGVDHSVIMKLSGHKTPSMFQRDNTVDVGNAKIAYSRLEEELLSQEEAQAKRAPRVLPTAAGAKTKVATY